MKKIFIIIVSLFIAFCPSMTLCNFSYADDSSTIDPEWTFIVDAEHNMQDTFFISAFKAYMNANKAFNKYTYTGEKAIVNWTYDKLNTVCQTFGLGSIEDYYDQIALAVDNDGNFKFWYTASGLKFMDDLFKAYLQNYDILTDDEEKTIFTGEWFEDPNNNGCYIYELNTSLSFTSNYVFTDYTSKVTQTGTPYIYNFNSIKSLYNNATSDGTTSGTFSLTFNPQENTTFTQQFSCYPLTTPNRHIISYYSFNTTNTFLFSSYQNDNALICIFTYRDNYYIGTHTIFNDGSKKFNFHRISQLSSNDVSLIDQIIDLAKKGADNANLALAKNAVIDVGKMGADIGVAAVNHLKDQDEDEPEVETPDDEPIVNPPKPTPPVVNPNNPSNPTGVFQDPNGGFNFQMPDINIDWSLNLDVNNLPFPFSIPHDIYNAFNSLNVEAEPPHFEGTVDLIITDWDIDIDFSDYSSLANIVNKWFLFVYVVGLIIATRSLMHIY